MKIGKAKLAGDSWHYAGEQEGGVRLHVELTEGEAGLGGRAEDEAVELCATS